MTLRQKIKKVIKRHKNEIKHSKEFFYSFGNYELNISDYWENGFFDVVLYPRNDAGTIWEKPIFLNPIKL